MNQILTTQAFRSFSNGRSLLQTATGGEVTDGLARDGSPQVLPFAAGAVVLAGPFGELICGPLDADGAEALAVAVIEGDQRISTSPALALRLAAAVLALIGEQHRGPTATEASHAES